MKPPDPALHPLARRLLEEEAEPRGEPAMAAAAAEEVFDRLRHRLIALIGARGFEALLRRALKLAQAETRGLASVEVTPDGELVGLSTALAQQPAGDAVEEAVTLLAHFLDLLATFIGAELTSRIVATIGRGQGEAGRASEDR